jgi:23S rRNA pseudouridine955/2504/2580 synthase
LVHGRGSLAEAVEAAYRGRVEPSLSFTPGPLHRLDRNTSGLLVFGKTLVGAREFSRLLREGRIIKIYWAILEGVLEGEETWEDALVRENRITRIAGEGEGGAGALCRIRPLAVRGGRTLGEIRLDTGRTHQIRAQAAGRGHPLAGDSKYGAREGGGYFLHARQLEIPPGPLLPQGLKLQAPAPESGALGVTRDFPPRYFAG